MEIMGKCPYFGKPCLKEDCSAFHYEERCLYDEPDGKYMQFFKKEKKMKWPNKKEYWYAVGIPYCRALVKELPIIREESKPEATPMPDGGV